MLSSKRLLVFRELAERGSFTATADALSYTQSAISQQIAALEREAGTALIERNRRRTRLTPAGEILLAHAEAILGRIAHAERELSEYAQARAGSLRLAAFESAGAALVPAAVASFHERYGEIELRVVQMEPEEATARLESRELDLAVVYDLEPPTGALGDELELTHLLDDRYTAVLCKGHPLAGKRALKLRELASDTWINTTARDLCHQVILGACREAGFEPQVAFEVDEIATSQALVVRGAGVTLLPELALGSRHRDVVIASLGEQAPVRSIYLARLSAAHPTPASEAMAAILREVAARSRERRAALAGGAAGVRGG